MTNPSSRQVALDPEWIAHAFDKDGASLTSVFVPSASRAELVFLSEGQFRGRFATATLPATDVAAEAAAAPQGPLHFIFHTSFCGSTLLANALNIGGKATSLSEPNILVNLAEEMIRRGDGNERRLDLALRLLARPFGSGESIVVKPSSFANRLIEPILNARPGSRGVLLYSDAETFLGSVVKRGLLGRINARKLYTNLVPWTSLRFGFSPAETFEQTDLQVAALAWLMQIAHFDRLAKTFGPERLIVLDAADLIADPKTNLERVQSFFGLDLDANRISEIVSGPVFSKHSKFADRDYDPEARERDREALMKVHAEELGMVLQWLSAVAGHLGAPLRPGASA